MTARGQPALRVLLLIDELENGGAERQLALFATSLPGEWDRRVWAMGGGPFQVHLAARGVRVDVSARRARFDPSVAVSLWRIVRAWRPDVVHSWSWMSTFAAAPICRVLRTPLVDGTIRTGALQSDFLALKRIGFACAGRIVANTHAGLQAWGVGPRKGRVVYNGFDNARLEALQDVDPPSESPFTVIMTGRMTAVKEFGVVIDAARRLAAGDHNWRFLLVGSGPERGRLLGEAAGLVETGVVEFPDGGMEVLGHVRHSHVGVLMTNQSLAQEGCSNAIMEYMACGLPVVCSSGGGNPEVVREGLTGFVIPPGDSEALAERLTYLRSNPEVATAMGEAGRARIGTEFSVEAMVQGMVDVYEELLACSPAVSRTAGGHR